MHFTSSYYPYSETGAFNTCIEDYLNDEPLLRPFYAHRPDLGGIKYVIEARKNFKIDRKLLVQKFCTQYQDVSNKEAVEVNISKLQNEHCFTICTAHQPHLFTGPLYVVYKILHAIKLAEDLSIQFPAYQFVPVYFMGSEDADMDELGQVKIQDDLCRWETKQSGAFGRMKVDDALLSMLDKSRLASEPYGGEIIQMLRTHFVKGQTIQQCTFTFIHALFGKYGLLVLLPDDQAYKNAFRSIMERELLDGFSHKAVLETISTFPEKYKVQTTGRDINLFYLKDHLRERIVKEENDFIVRNTNIRFTAEEIKQELANYPERFSPNVILRPVYQEMLLPNVAFIGGGSELVYWMELKQVFELANVPYPVLFLRNSFLLINSKIDSLIKKRSFSDLQLFKPTDTLIREWIMEHEGENVFLTKELNAMHVWFDSIKQKAVRADLTLEKHTEALYMRFNKLLKKLEQKMFRAEKKKQETLIRQLQMINVHTHPNGVLQERVETFVNLYARYGSRFLDHMYQHSKSLDQQFCILTEKS